MSHHYSGPDFGLPPRGCPLRPHRSICLSQAWGCWQVDPDYERAPVLRLQPAGAHHRCRTTGCIHAGSAQGRASGVGNPVDCWAIDDDIVLDQGNIDSCCTFPGDLLPRIGAGRIQWTRSAEGGGDEAAT